MKNALFSISKRFYYWLGTLVILLCLAAVQFSQGAKIQTNIMALLPQDKQNPAAEMAFARFADKLSNQVIFLVGQQDLKQAIAASDAFAARLKQFDWLTDVQSEIDSQTQAQWGKLFFPYRYQLLTNAQRERLGTHPEQQLTRVKTALFSPFAGVSSQELSQDPMLLFREFIGQLGAHAGKLNLINSHLVATSGQRHYVLVRAKLKGSAYQLSIHQQIPELKRVENAINQRFNTEILRQGVVFYAAQGTESAQQEISTIGLGSLLGIILILVLVYRSGRPLFLALLSVCVGLLLAYVSTRWVFGEVHLFSLIFGASLTGVSIDYAFHYLTERQAMADKWDSDQGLRMLMPAITLGLLTSVIGYLGLLSAPFPGLQQLALFSTMGLIGAFFTVVCAYPYLTQAPSSKGLSARTQVPVNLWLQFWRWRAVRILLPVCMLGFSLWGLFHASYNDDIRLLQSLPSDLQYQEKRMGEIMGQSTSPQFLLIQGQNAEEVLQLQERLLPELDQLVQDHVISGYQALASYLPSQAKQKQNFALVQKLYLYQGPQLARQLGMSFNTQIQNDAYTPLTLATVLSQDRLDLLSTLWLGEIDGQASALILLNGLTDAQPLQTLANQYNAVQYLDKADQVSEILKVYRHHVAELIIIAYGLIALLLLWRYGIRRALVLMLPPVTAGLVGLACVALSGYALNLFNLLAIILVLGIGIDYTLFFAEQERQKHQLPHATLLAVTLSALTTILSFGLLSLSQTHAIHSFGITVFTGIATAWLLSPLALRQVRRGTIHQEMTTAQSTQVNPSQSAKQEPNHDH
ncbi:hypothetical protein VST7929_01859 [Vibrio stylophorae]|uniref:Membrane transport protein MMPL domain-containing protein n=1 Tax=Vibrio stylophorae TaxID=659351 RepID=A0ABN8DVA1_9VIBR|nr:MMPL family transporter [Vibrio stylophorae]CAH0533977.1 hypothetical protein VST7929_01859 [Vibrio stylophorae]